MSRRARGTGSIRQMGGGFQARYSFVDVAGKRRQRAVLFGTRTEARKWLNARLHDIDAGNISDSGSMTLGQYLVVWLRSPGVAECAAATVSWYRSAITRHIIPALGHVKLSRLTPLMIEGFLAEKKQSGHLGGRGRAADKAGQPLGEASVRRLQVTLHKSLDAAVRKGLLHRNPVDLVDKRRMPTRDATIEVWSPAEIQRFLAATRNDRLAALWRLDAMTGLRRSEVCGLYWDDLDLEAGGLSVRRAVVIVDGVPIVKDPKTDHSRRSVDLDSATVVMLREHRKTQLEERLRAGAAWQQGDWVFTDELGQPVNPNWLSRRFSALAIAAELPPITLRQVRHSHATALLGAKVHAKVVQERLGHSSITITMDTYSAVLPNMQREAVEQLAAAMDAK